MLSGARGSSQKQQNALTSAAIMRHSTLTSTAIMRHSTLTSTARREFLKFLAASPYVAAFGGVTAYLRQSAFAQSAPQASDVIADPAGALNVFDFEEAAHRKVLPRSEERR